MLTHRIHHAAGAALAAALLAGCSSQFSAIDPPFPPHPASEMVKDESVTLSFGTAETLTADPAMQARLRADCSPPSPTPGQEILGLGRPGPGLMMLPAIGAVVAPIAIDFAVKQVKAYLEQQDKKYEASFSARQTGQFYDGGDKPAFPCFRVTRTVRDLDAAAFDFVGKFDVSEPDLAAVRIIPVYHRYANTKARTGSGGRFTSNMTLTFEAVWVDERKDVRSVKEATFSTTIEFGQLSLADAPVRRDTAAPAAASAWFPAVPRSVITGEGRATIRGNGNFAMTATVYETASAKDVTARAIKLYADNEQALKDKLAAALVGE